MPHRNSRPRADRGLYAQPGEDGPAGADGPGRPPTTWPGTGPVSSASGDWAYRSDRCAAQGPLPSSAVADYTADLRATMATAASE